MQTHAGQGKTEAQDQCTGLHTQCSHSQALATHVETHLLIKPMLWAVTSDQAFLPTWRHNTASGGRNQKAIVRPTVRVHPFWAQIALAIGPARQERRAASNDRRKLTAYVVRALNTWDLQQLATTYVIQVVVGLMPAFVANLSKNLHVNFIQSLHSESAVGIPHVNIVKQA